jgi:S1-C subfamily serine protease
MGLRHCLVVWSVVVVLAQTIRADDKTTEGSKAGYLGIQVRSTDDGKEILILDVVAGSPAEAAGLKANDVIVQMEGEKVVNLEEFVKKVRNCKPGEKVKLHVRRDNKEIEVTVTIGKAPDGSIK